MEVGYFAVGIGPTVDPEWVRTIATTAERLGFATIWAPEHVVLLEQFVAREGHAHRHFRGRLHFAADLNDHRAAVILIGFRTSVGLADAPQT